MFFTSGAGVAVMKWHVIEGGVKELVGMLQAVYVYKLLVC
jgi:hypothetical protein